MKFKQLVFIFGKSRSGGRSQQVQRFAVYWFLSLLFIGNVSCVDFLITNSSFDFIFLKKQKKNISTKHKMNANAFLCAAKNFHFDLYNKFCFSCIAILLSIQSVHKIFFSSSAEFKTHSHWTKLIFYRNLFHSSINTWSALNTEHRRKISTNRDWRSLSFFVDHYIKHCEAPQDVLLWKKKKELICLFSFFPSTSWMAYEVNELCIYFFLVFILGNNRIRWASGRKRERTHRFANEYLSPKPRFRINRSDRPRHDDDRFISGVLLLLLLLRFLFSSVFRWHSF